MADIILAGNISGSVTIAAPAIAGTTVITLPATTGTLISSGGALGTPSSGTLTSCTGLPMTTGVTGTLPIANGGTNSTATAYCSLTTNISGTLPVANGGTGVTTSTGSGANVLGTSPTLITPALGTPASGVLTNCTGVARAALPAGCVLQVVSATLSSTFTTTSTSFVDTGITVAITPRSTSSKIFITVSGNSSTSASSGIMWLNLVANGTPICIGDTAGLRTSSSFSMAVPAAVNIMGAFGINFLHSPATVSAVTYKIQTLVNNSQVAAINAGYGDGNTSGYPRTASTITVMEIQG